ncbi:low specificity L-threonine aldolase [Prosthecomicrobium hirschii]|uniref:threonine aldolase family protein n=1 Tax=Prosthecodimorpha hirschii TaxID=665126 RepID=UPI00112748CA|nr:beta-eliminating lyase-related protein [Prosthecomicrobium hirschii]TPQ50886.1 low specificity L-threonine aldolase [Prosthecomicrobium hirschii]
MIFASDNWAGASEAVMAALVAANQGPAPAYGNDEITRRLEVRMSDLFERDVAVFLVATGTAANALATAAFAPPWGAILAHRDAHLNVDECGAPEFFAGTKVVGLAGARGKIDPRGLVEALDDMPAGVVHHVQPAVLSLTQSTELGTVYAADEVAELAGIVKNRNIAVHMDGARFANAISSLQVAPSTLTWRAGVDVLSFGATKGGALMAEAIVLFDRSRQEALGYLRKRAAQLVSKHRFVAAQFDAWLDSEHWLDLADHANAMATRLAVGLDGASAARLAWMPEANEVFAFMAPTTAAALRAEGATFYEWPASGLAVADRPRPGEVLYRLVTSFRTEPAEVDRFVALVGGAPAMRQDGLETGRNC